MDIRKESENMNIPKDFRYQSNWNQFKKATDYFLDCLKKDKAYLLYGCFKNIYIDMPDENPMYEKIITGEISSLIEEALDNSYDTSGLEGFLQERCSVGEIQSSDIDDILELVDKKYQYIIENIISDDMMKRYFFKENTIVNKLSAMQVDINKYIINDADDIKYALIRMGANSKLPNFAFPRQMSGLIDSNEKSIEFVCDAHDLEYLIAQLEIIRKKLN